MTGRCGLCSHSFAIHTRGICPRWGLRGLDDRTGTRICVRVAHKWPECAGHVMAYFADCVDDGMVLVWDLTNGQQFEAPTLTVRAPWTQRPSTDVTRIAADDLALSIGGRVAVVRNLA
jgi:hypothetical protein